MTPMREADMKRSTKRCLAVISVNLRPFLPIQVLAEVDRIMQDHGSTRVHPRVKSSKTTHVNQTTPSHNHY